ncbi:MAG: cysteine desulfurase [Campylobacteraceae bacterium]|nr:cysteine desulfurase [Campylobacteraceae bacterium]
MYKLNSLQYKTSKDFQINSDYSLEVLKDNTMSENLIKDFKKKFSYSSLKTMSLSYESFLGFLFTLEGKISVSLGESENLVKAALKYKNLGLDIDFININKDGKLAYEEIKEDCNFLFLSSYIMDTYVKVDLKRVRTLTSAKIISNISANLDCCYVDIAFFDAYKLTSFASSSIVLHNGELSKQNIGEIDIIAIKNIYESFSYNKKYANKSYFIKCLEEELKEDIFFFVDNSNTLENSLHFGLKGIKAREVIRTLSLASIFVTNGEGCSLGLSKPSRILQSMSYTELESRQALSLSLDLVINDEEIKKIAKKIAKAYRQIKALNE